MWECGQEQRRVLAGAAVHIPTSRAIAPLKRHAAGYGYNHVPIPSLFTLPGLNC